MFYFIIFSILMGNVICTNNPRIGDLPNIIREEFIKILTYGAKILRPICPQSEIEGNIKLIFYNRTFPDGTIILDANNPHQIDPNKHLVILIHGWLGSSTAYGVPELKNSYLKHYDCNVIIVDWPKLAWQSYPNAFCHLPHIGEYVAQFLCNLSKQTEVALEKIHIVGHSLGAQMAGLIGQFSKSICKQSIGRITGLDPAGPIYQDQDAAERLDEEDANFVDVIHTDEGALGYYGNCGTVDFHVNCGTIQPGTINLAKILDIFNMTISLVAGNHLRSLELMAATINSTDFKSQSCTSCPERCLPDTTDAPSAVMGEHCREYSSPRGSYYVATSAEWPYYTKGCSSLLSLRCALTKLPIIPSSIINFKFSLL